MSNSAMTTDIPANPPREAQASSLRPALIIFALSGALYMLLDAANAEGLWMAALKIVPIATLLWLAASSLVGTGRTLALVALGFSATGDVLLAIDFPNHFIFGLGAFLLAQLTYAVTFGRRAHFSLCLAGRAFAILVAAGMLAAKVVPAAGDLALPVSFYIVAIVTMALCAAAYRGGSSLLFCGALTFMASDALIAINRFVEPVALAGTWIMLTYYLAQALLVCGLIRAELAARVA
ncbi:lysoplasmalogenase [Microbulbifer sp. CAU 1566]|uniref:lysoplasmalogenase n=1 Tax=Microbulbifer sp. CAU 1566 TaxID=2933269 RepID=UPI0020066FF5|nr:lysoplasmalogenase [Microbulbifer sp. CAU 1566]MCK7597844.1 lysoplasmalogenase [Microbulbifer sp. CAU 1566]